MKKTKNLVLVALFFMTATIFGQGVTTSAIGGKITDNNGEPLPGANVTAVHQPTGTKYGTSTDFDGYFRLSNLKSGGPYVLSVSFMGFKNYDQKNIVLSLGETKRFSIKLLEDSNTLDEVVIKATNDGVFGADKTGSETTIGEKQMATMASASRSVADFVRLTPQTQISEGDDGFSISISGQNNRYNSIYIDGAVNNDVFGLAGSGTNGGQTGVSPFSIDAIEQFQVNIAPFDVKISGFTGGAVSAITRSGTNEFEGSAYFFTRNENLAGKTPVDLAKNEREKLGKFTANTYGVRLGGPIVKDKLFFFINYERQDDETPQPYNISNYSGDSKQADIDRLKQHILSKYNYDIGGFDNALRTLKSNKITAKLDWNANENNKVSLKHSYVGAENLETRSSSSRRLGFSGGSEFFKSNTNSSSLEWNFQSDKVSNNLLLGYTRVRDDRDPQGNPFPSVFIGDGLNPFAFQGILLGAEPYSTANLLDTDIFTVTNNVELYYGRHKFTFGMHHEFAKVKNLFFAFNYGRYFYNSVDDFINNNSFRYERGYSLLSKGAGDTSSGAAEFSTKQFGFYVQDEIDVTNDLKVTAGIRFDTPFWENGAVNNDFNTRTVALLEAQGKDLKGARVGKKVSTTTYFSPRFGFNWNVKGKSKTQVRGGVGIFTSRLPLVWPGATYNNNGITGGWVTKKTTTPFEPNVNNQPVGAVPGTGQLGGNVDLFVPDFKLPQVLKYNIAVDQKLPFGFTYSGDFVYNDNLNAIYYENLNVENPTKRMLGKDNRLLYSGNSIDRTYQRVILASNTKEGYSWNTSHTLRKKFRSNLVDVSTSATYSYGDAKAIFDGTSSQNSSQWRGIQTVNGKNSKLPLTTSDFSQGHRAMASVSAEFKWNKKLKTTIGLFYDGVQGQPFSYIYGSADRSRVLNDDSRDNALVYVPAQQSDINLVDFTSGGKTITAQEQWNALNSFIENNEYLKSRRGKYAERNGDRGAWSHVVDLKFIQDITLDAWGKGHTLQLTADIFNFTNLLNKEWGVRYYNPNGVTLINVQKGRGKETPQFTFDPNRLPRVNQVDDSGIQSSRWQMQVGLRYIFK